MRFIAICLLIALHAAGAAAQERVGTARECSAPDETGCEQPLVVTGGRCAAIAGDPDARWRRAEIDRFTNACYTCDDLGMDFRFGELLGFFRCQKRYAAGEIPSPPEPDWQQRACTRYALLRETPDSLTLRVRNQCAGPITVNACATWQDGRERAQRSGDAAVDAEARFRWPVSRYTVGRVVWNYCAVGGPVACPAPCPDG